MEKFLQKISGLFLILFSLLVAWLDNDAGAAVLFVPLGLYLIFTQKQVMYW